MLIACLYTHQANYIQELEKDLRAQKEATKTMREKVSEGWVCGAGSPNVGVEDLLIFVRLCALR